MDVMVQHLSKIRGAIVSSRDHGWVNDKVDSGTRECNLMEDVRSKFVDELFRLLPMPLDKRDDYCHSFKEPEDIKTLQDEAMNNVFRTCSEEDANASNMEIDGASSLEIDGYNNNIVNPVVREIRSAMKGSRQQHGLKMKTPSVSFAPDVYDPPVTSQCHLVKANSPKHSRLHKKGSKHKHKAKSIRNGSKVKK